MRWYLRLLSVGCLIAALGVPALGQGSKGKASKVNILKLREEILRDPKGGTQLLKNLYEIEACLLLTRKNGA